MKRLTLEAAIFLIFFVMPGNSNAQSFNLAQTISDGAQRATLAFDGLAMMTGNLNAQSFFPPGKVADYTGFQYLRDNDPDGMGHNTSFLTRVAYNVIFILNDTQLAQLSALAVAQQSQVNTYGYNRYPLMKAFRRLMDGDTPSNSFGLSLGAVKAASRSLYLIDGQISLDRAALYSSMINSFNATQKAYLLSMRGKGWNSWPDITDAQVAAKMASLPQGSAVLVMTYAGDLFSWYAGSLDADVYFCPERQGTYYGGFYIKDAPAVGHEGYSISTSLTAVAGNCLFDSSQGYVTSTQGTIMSSLVDTQRSNLYSGGANASIVGVRTQIAILLRGILNGTNSANAVKSQVLTLSGIYGDLDGVNNYNYATIFAKIYQSMSTAQKAKLMTLRQSILSGNYSDGTPYDYTNCTTPFLYSNVVSNATIAPYIANTDYLFFEPAALTPISPVNSTSTASGIPQTPYLAGPYIFTGGTNSSYNYYQLFLTPPGSTTATSQFIPAAACNSTSGLPLCWALLKPSSSWTTGVYQWRVRGLTYNQTTGTFTYGNYSAISKFNATTVKGVRLLIPNGTVSSVPANFTWRRAPGATYYKLELYKGTEAVHDAIAGATGHSSLPSWYNASGPGNSNSSNLAYSGRTAFDVDCSTDTNVCSLPMSVVTNGISASALTASLTSSALGDYFWRVTPFGAGMGISNSSTFYLNGTNAPPQAPTVSCPHPPDSSPPSATSSRPGRCNVTSASPLWGWSDTARGPNDGYEIGIGPNSASLTSYFRAFILRNSTKMINYYTGALAPTYSNASRGNNSGPCIKGYCNASFGSTSISGSILTNTGMHRLYIRSWSKTSGSWLTSSWSNFTFYVAAPTLGLVANMSPSGALSFGGGDHGWQDRQMFFPRIAFNGVPNASWYGVSITGTPILSGSLMTATNWFPKAMICNASDAGSRPRCVVNSTSVSNSTFAYGMKPSFTYTVYPFAPGHLSDYSNYKSSATTVGSTAVPGTPSPLSPVSYSSTGGQYSWNSSLAKGNATFFEMYICRRGFTSVATQCPYHDYIPVNATGYPAANNTGIVRGVFHGTTAIKTTRSGASWVYTLTVPDTQMSKGADSGAPWTSGQYIWGVRGINPNGYNSGSGALQWALGNFTK